MIICKWLYPPHDHLQKAGSSGWSFARGRILRMIICNNDNNNDNNKKSTAFCKILSRKPHLTIFDTPKYAPKMHIWPHLAYLVLGQLDPSVKSYEQIKVFGSNRPIAQCVLCKVYFPAQPNKLRPILNFKKYYPFEHICVPACSSVRKIHFFKF